MGRWVGGFRKIMGQEEARKWFKVVSNFILRGKSAGEAQQEGKWKIIWDTQYPHLCCGRFCSTVLAHSRPPQCPTAVQSNRPTATDNNEPTATKTKWPITNDIVRATDTKQTTHNVLHRATIDTAADRHNNFGLCK